MRHDKFDLRQAVDVGAVRFLNDGQCVATAERTQIRVYDPRAQRRPVKQVTWSDKPIRAISTCCKDQQLLAGNNGGDVGLIDLRGKECESFKFFHMGFLVDKDRGIAVKSVCKFKGTAGAIRSIDAHPTLPHLAACGLGRFVTVHELDTSKLVKKVNHNPSNSK